MSALDDAADRVRRDLLAHDQRAAAEIAKTYQRVHARLVANLGALTDKIEQAIRPGQEVRPGWLLAQDRYVTLISDLEHDTSEWAGHVTAVVADTQRAVLAEAVEQGRRLTIAALGPAPRSAVASVEGRLGRMHAAALERLIGRTVGGHPLAALLQQIAPTAVTEVRDALAYGVAAGRNPRLIASEVAKVSDIPLTRARTIARTEVLGAFRAATRDEFQQSPVVTGWVWTCALSARTCPACWAQHGTIHPADEVLSSHPNCRCVMTPRTPSWADLGFTGIPDQRPAIETGRDVFSRLPAAEQRQILGPARYALYADGLDFDRLAQPTLSAVWGPGIRTTPVKELVAG